MSDPSASPGKKRNLPSWMSSRQKQKNDEGENRKQGGGGSEGGSKEKDDFSKLLEGVIFVLSGFVNPERGVLRSRAMEMGAEYQADWNSNCTLLVCAFPNTPKFRQVESDCGTIVSKEWISECYNKRKLVDIDPYLMHAGKPWRKQSIASKTTQDQEPSTSKKSQKQVEKAAYSNPNPKASLKHIVASSTEQEYFVPSKVKKWAADDFSKTISWLESQDEKPDPSDMKKIAAEGILTCLQDAIDSLKQDQEIQHISEQWNFVPRVVEELVKLERSQDEPLPKKHLYKQALACKEIYEKELKMLNDSFAIKKKLKTGDSKRSGKERNETPSRSADYDSDETIEMTEEDIDKAYNSVASALCKS
ncbi:DNA-repair protein XRCC1 [Heracleum sosnowskyi]|uniref:DNA-repair protein XRCC1 n=1 Tax=Heracleum sosnowskyi TaxID=360622 RepID=A0AAD8H2E6_9APIA|nr:DNA-repair protein XRCC1 [Heracleum sosnowskyi]